jgi:hypothetical protein
MFVFMDAGQSRIILRFPWAAGRTGKLDLPHRLKSAISARNFAGRHDGKFYSMGLSVEIGSDFNEK